MKYKILFVHENFCAFGGAERHLLETASVLKEEFDLYYLSENVLDEKYHTLFADHFTTHCPIRPDLVFLHKCLSPHIFKTVQAWNVPIVHMIHDHEGYCLRGSKFFPISQTPCPYKAGLCCLFPGLAFLRKNAQGHLQFKWKNPVRQKSLIKLDQRCTSFLVASNFMKNTLEIQGYDPGRIEVLFGVPNIGEFSTPSFSEENILIYSGSLLRGKGLEYLMKALALVDIPFKLEVFGSGGEKNNLLKLVNQLGLDAKVTFRGFCSHQEMMSTLSKATCGVFPSIWPEPLGMSGIEMLQNGLPVVGFDSGAVSEWLQDGKNGLLAKSKDIGQFALKIQQLLLDKELAKRLGKQGQDYVESAYNFNHYTKALADKFNKMIDSSKQ